MDILDIIKSRRSIRDFSDKEIPDGLVRSLIEAIQWAPSAGNLQSRKFFFVWNKQTKTRLSKAALDQKFIIQAPLAIVACSDNRIQSRYGERGTRLYAIQDVAASIQNVLLTAHALGLGSVWIGAFRDEEVSDALQLPDYLKPVALIAVGYPLKTPGISSRKSAAEIVTHIY